MERRIDTMYMKRGLAAITISALLISGAAAFASNAATTASDTKHPGISRANHGSRLEEILTKLVEKGYLSSATKEVVLAAAKDFKPETPIAGTLKTSDMAKGQRLSGDPVITALKDKGLITADAYSAVTAAMDKLQASENEARFADQVKSGAFPDTTAADKAFRSLQNQLHTKMEAQRSSHKADTSAVKARPTQAEREQLQATMKAEHDQNLKDVLAAMVASGEITSAQADALKTLVENGKAGDGGFGHRGGPDGNSGDRP